MSEEDTLPWPLLLKVLGAVVAGGILLSAIAALVLGIRERQLHATRERRPVQVQLFEEVPPEPFADGYAWVDREKRLVRIPISEAMELVARGTRP